MTPELAIKNSKFLSFSFNVDIDEMHSVDYLYDASHSNWADRTELVVDKLLWALYVKIGMPPKSLMPLSLCPTGLYWSQSARHPENCTDNLFKVTSDAWDYMTMSGSSDIVGFEDYLRTSGISTLPPLALLFSSIIPLCFSEFSQCLQQNVDDIVLDFEGWLSDGIIDLNGLCYYMNADEFVADEVSDTQIANDLALIWNYLMISARDSVEPNDICYDIPLTLMPEYTVQEYASELLGVVREIFFSSLPMEAFLKIAPYGIQFLAEPEYMTLTSDTYNVNLWTFVNKTTIPTYLKWRGEHPDEDDPVISAMDNAVIVIRNPFGPVADVATNLEVIAADTHVVCCITGDYGKPFADPCYLAAREIFDTLFPIWEKKYCQADCG